MSFEMKDMESIRSWLISKGIPAAELDDVEENQIIRDIGEGLVLSLMNDEFIGQDLFLMMMRMDELEQRVAKLEAAKGGA